MPRCAFLTVVRTCRLLESIIEMSPEAVPLHFNQSINQVEKFKALMTVFDVFKQLEARKFKSYYTARSLPSAETLKEETGSRTTCFVRILFQVVVFHVTILAPLSMET